MKKYILYLVLWATPCIVSAAQQTIESTHEFVIKRTAQLSDSILNNKSFTHDQYFYMTGKLEAYKEVELFISLEER